MEVTKTVEVKYELKLDQDEFDLVNWVFYATPATALAGSGFTMEDIDKMTEVFERYV